MRNVSRSLVSVAVAAILFPALSSSAPKPKPPPGPPVNLEMDSPAYRADKPLGVMYSSGTTLHLKATMERSLGIFSVGSYVGGGQTGWIILADPDNCVEIIANMAPMRFQSECLQQLYPDIPEDDYPDSSIVPDETYLQFTIDRDAPGLADFTWNTDLADPTRSGEPVFAGVTRQLIGNEDPETPREFALGPYTGGTADDGFGYGSDDDLPGLVLLSNHGMGIVYVDPDGDDGTRLLDFAPAYPRARRNLAGFLNAVSYELKSNNGKTKIHAEMTLPDGLIAPIVAVDNCLSIGVLEGECNGTNQFQVDGGPMQYNGGGDFSGSGYGIWREQLGATTFEVRAFLVSGVAPSQLADLNLDDQVTAADATLAGYTVISDEAVARFRQYPAFLCSEQGGLTTVFGSDFDNNGSANIHIECPPGSGQLKTIP
jgi:hypothetical protein